MSLIGNASRHIGRNETNREWPTRGQCKVRRSLPARMMCLDVSLDVLVPDGPALVWVSRGAPTAFSSAFPVADGGHQYWHEQTLSSENCPL
jgi:hypothetical protein